MFQTGARDREQALFGSFYLLTKLPSIRQLDVVLSEHLSGGAAAKNRTRSFLVQVMDGFIEGKGYRLRHIFTFDKTEAEKVLIGFASGSNADRDKVSVRDIDVFGFHRH